MYRNLALHTVIFMILMFAFTAGGCGRPNASSAPTGGALEDFAENNPGVLIPADEELDDYSEDEDE